MRTTDDIIEELRANRDARLAAGELVDGSAVEQEIIAHQELARLRERAAAAVKAKDLQLAADLAGQIRHWLRFITVDVDVPDLKKNSTKLVDAAAVAGSVKG